MTLTYESVPPNGSLSVYDCQSFLKRLRARLNPVRIRFFLCGEYGEKLGRPHYHAIIFGFGFPDKVPLSNSFLPGKFQLYSSELLSSTWGHGLCSIGSVTFESASYVANYATKKVVGDKAAAHYGGRKPEFLLMSRRPGIARGWIDKFSSDVYPSDEVIVRGRPARPPRYYDQVMISRHGAGSSVVESFRASREAAASSLEAVVRKGVTSLIAPSLNARRLDVRRRVAEAKLQLKSRSSEL